MLEKQTVFAALDVGTVTCRMLIAQMREGRMTELERLYEITDLGEGVDASRRLLPEAMDRVLKAVGSFVAVLRSYENRLGGKSRLRAITTSAARDAENAGDLIAGLKDLGIELEVVSGQEEASLSFAGVSAEFPDEPLMVVDIGGGSTEVVLGSAACGVEAARSFDIGCRRVTERLLGEGRASSEQRAEVRRWVADQVGPWLSDHRAFLDGGFRMIGVAGTATTAVSVRDGLIEYRADLVHGRSVSSFELADVADRLAGLDLEHRCRVTGLDPKRAPVIVAGLTILQELVAQAGLESFTVSESDILQGVVLELAREEGALISRDLIE